MKLVLGQLLKQSISECLLLFEGFWLRYPLFWIGLHILVGTGAAAGWGYALIPFVAILWIPFILHLQLQRLLSASLLLSCSWFGASFVFEPTELPPDGINGMLYFSISQVKPSQTPFGQFLSYQGQAKGFLSDEKRDLHKIPCQILLKDSKKRPLANCDYIIYGRLNKTRKGQYVFKPDSQQVWKPVKNTYSFAEWRLQCKRKVSSFIKHRFGHTPCSSLFTSLATGDIDERMLAIEFGRLGLSHILAISGFHFTLFASFLLFFFSMIFPFRVTQIIVLGLVGSYLFFLGPSPSAMRAWCAISIALTGRISLLRSSGINALGAGLALILLFDPALCQNLGFQLSFLCTAALLLLYKPCEQLLSLLFIQRSTKVVKTMPFLDQHGALIATLLRKTLALTLAVHIVTLPVCLFYFSTFPLIGSLIYNLFFPLLLSLSLFLLLTGCMLDSIFPWLGHFLHAINQGFTNFLLNSVSNAPIAVKGVICASSITPLTIVLWLSSLLVLAIAWQKRGDTSYHPR